MNRRKLTVFTIVLITALLAGSSTARAGVPGRNLAVPPIPQVVSYQGQVTVDGKPYEGTGYFKFAVVNQAGDTTYWSNDGTISGEPENALELALTSGLFNVLLGDTDLKMPALMSDVFAGPDRYLRAWFSSDNSTFTLLVPDRRIAAVPFALQAEVAQYALDADTLDGLHASSFASSTHNHDTTYVNENQVNSVTSIMLVDGPGSGVDADLLDGQHGSAYQVRVSGTCAVGSTIRAINADGSVTCQVDAPLNRPAPPADNNKTTFPTGGGHDTSVTIGVDGLALISHYDTNSDDLMVTHCSNTACSSATHTLLDAAGDVGQHTSIAIGSDGLGVISYYDATNQDLKVAHCSNIICSTFDLHRLETPGVNDGLYTSIAISASGLPLISYYDSTNQDLVVAHCADAACSTMMSTALDTTGNVGMFTSMVIGADGLALIAYQDADNFDLKVARCTTSTCVAANISTLDSAGSTGFRPSITIGPDGLGLISYHAGDTTYLKAAHCSNTTCSTATTTSLITAGSSNIYSSITVGADGLPLISYNNYSGQNRLNVAHCSDTTCSSASHYLLDASTLDIGRWNAVTIGADGLPLISYGDGISSTLKVVHCNNLFCVPFFRRR